MVSVSGGSDCPEILGSMNQSTGPCNWIFEVEDSGDGVEVTWNFGDASSEVSGILQITIMQRMESMIVTAYLL